MTMKGLRFRAQPLKRHVMSVIVKWGSLKTWSKKSRNGDGGEIVKIEVTQNQAWASIVAVVVCVCVCGREREREVANLKQEVNGEKEAALLALWSFRP